jgi:hypothetical protein
VLLIVPCSVGMALLTKGLYPVELPAVKNPDFIDTIFDNRAVLWAARLLPTIGLTLPWWDRKKWLTSPSA